MNPAEEELRETLWFLENMDDRLTDSDILDIWNVEDHLRTLREYYPVHEFNMN